MATAELDTTSPKQQAGAVGGAMIGATVGSQTANTVKDILKAKGAYKKHPYITAPIGALLSIGGTVTGVKAGTKITGKKTSTPVEVKISNKELQELVKKYDIEKTSCVRLWYPII